MGTLTLVEALEMSDEEQRERWAVYGGWRDARMLEDVGGQERLVDRHAGRSPGVVDRSDATIAHETLKIVGRSIEQHCGP